MILKMVGALPQYIDFTAIPFYSIGNRLAGDPYQVWITTPALQDHRIIENNSSPVCIMYNINSISSLIIIVHG